MTMGKNLQEMYACGDLTKLCTRNYKRSTYHSNQLNLHKALNVT